MDDETIEDDIEAEVEALVQEMDAEIDGSSNAEELATDQTDGSDDDLNGRLKSDQATGPSYQASPSIVPWDEQPPVTNEVSYDKEVDGGSVEIIRESKLWSGNPGVHAVKDVIWAKTIISPLHG